MKASHQPVWIKVHRKRPFQEGLIFTSIL